MSDRGTVPPGAKISQEKEFQPYLFASSVQAFFASCRDEL